MRTIPPEAIGSIDKRPRAEQVRVDDKEALHSLLSTCLCNLNDFVVITEAGPTDEAGPKIVFVNEAFERITGYTSAEALGRSPRFLQGEKTDRGLLAEIRRALSESQAIGRQIVNWRESGSEFWLDIDIVPIRDASGVCTHLAAIGRDVTEAKKTETRFRRLVDSSAQGVLFWNIKGGIIDANDAFLRLVGYTREDLESGRMNWIAMTPPEFAYVDRREVAVVTADGDCVPFEKEFIRKDGSRVPILMGAATFADNPNEGVSFVIDLTERKKLEHQFLRAQRMEGIGTLAGGIAHDLNNILAPIIMSIDILKLTAKDQQTQNILETIDLSAKRGADIVRQVLSFARGMEGERIEVQIKQVLKDVEAILRDTLPKNIRLKLSIPNESWTVLGDSTQLHQILLNLCINARDAMPDGGDLRITAEEAEIDEHYVVLYAQARIGKYVALSVTDSGTGISPDILDKIFEPFFTTKELGRGTGLGLSTVVAIVKGHGGFVNVYSQPGHGTAFMVFLPAIESSSQPRKEVLASEGLPRGNGETILVVDDEASIRVITSQTLEAFGYRALTATNGAEAVAIYALQRDDVSVVLTDMAMPIMDGWATIHALMKINPDIKIIAASGLSADAGLITMTGGGKYFLTKPYTARTLLKAIRRRLEGLD